MALYSPLRSLAHLTAGVCRLSTAASCRHVAPHVPFDDAFEMATSCVRYGPGVTSELGQDMANFGAKRVMLVTDPVVAQLQPVKTALDALARANIEVEVFEDVEVEPTDASFQRAIDAARRGGYDGFVGVGGGSALDTCKVVNLFACYPEAELLDFVNAPIGRARPVERRLHPLIAVPTTSGTGSETSGVAIFDYVEKRAKTGIASRALRPTLGLLDPLHTLTMPRSVALYSGLDVLCHALESYTAIPYAQRAARPENPLLRPAYQGSNPISDVWSLQALRYSAKYLKRSTNNADDTDARGAMHLAAAMAGIGFGNAGVHLCHGLSYGISGNIKSYLPEGYPGDHALVPHGLSVCISSPAVFEFTASACPERHLEAAAALGIDTRDCKPEDAGMIVADWLRRFMHDMGLPDGISALGYTSEDISGLVEATLPQHRVTKLSPRPVGRDELHGILENSMTVY